VEAETTAVRDDGAVEAAATCDEGVVLERRLSSLLEDFRFFPPTACTLDDFRFSPPMASLLWGESPAQRPSNTLWSSSFLLLLAVWKRKNFP
jgi:hypothetical protein